MRADPGKVRMELTEVDDVLLRQQHVRRRIVRGDTVEVGRAGAAGKRDVGREGRPGVDEVLGQAHKRSSIWH